MSDAVFILGTGAPKDTGVPLMAGFFDKSRDLMLLEK